jgi:hypothetical protein
MGEVGFDSGDVEGEGGVEDTSCASGFTEESVAQQIRGDDFRSTEVQRLGERR